MSRRSRLRRTRRGGVELRLPDVERELLVALASALRASLDGEDLRSNPALVRLFPPAYADPGDERADAEYHSLVHEDLAGGRRAALDTLLATVGDDQLDEDVLPVWMRSLNDLRLVLGTRLDVSEDPAERPGPGDPQAALHDVYDYLGMLLEEVLEASDPYAGAGAPPEEA